MTDQKTWIHPKALLLFAVFGISFSAIFIRDSHAPGMVLAAYRLGWTVLILAPYTWVKSGAELRKITRKDLLFCGLSGLSLALHFSLWFESLKFTSIASSTLLVCTDVIFVSIGFVLFMRGKLSAKAILAIVITLIGSAVIALADSHGDLAGDNLYGDFLALMGAIFGAAYALFGRKMRSSLSTSVYSTVTYAFCFFFLFLFCFIGQVPIFGYGWKEIWLGLGLGICCTVIGHTTLNWCLKFYSPSYVMAVKLLEPVFSTLLAILIFAEIPGLMQVVGGLIVLSGILYYTKIEE